MPSTHLYCSPKACYNTSTWRRPANIETTKGDFKRMNIALTDQKTIEQLSSSGNAANIKREELEERRKARKATEKAQEEEKKGGKSG
jgi:hypothetical protein